MPQAAAVHILQYFTPITISGVLLAIFLAATRLAPFTKPYWAWMPKKVQAFLPSFVAGLPMAIAAFQIVKTWMDLAQAVLAVGVIPLGLAMPGASSPHNHPELPPPAGTQGVSKTPSIGPMGGMLCFLPILLLMVGCAAILPYLAEASVVLADAVNSVDAAEALLPRLHLPEATNASAMADLAKCRKGIADADKLVDGATDLNAQKLDAALSDFKAAWTDLKSVIETAPNGIGATNVLPEPLALRRHS